MKSDAMGALDDAALVGAAEVEVLVSPPVGAAVHPLYVPDYVPGGKVEQLMAEVPWLHVQARRGECFMSREGRTYQYIPDGAVYVSVPFHPLVEAIMEQFNAQYGQRLNVCFLNYYRDHTQALDWHADDAAVIDQTEPIAVVSFGQEREIWWKPMGEKGNIPDDQKQLLGDGSLFVMPAGMQNTHFHKIPKGSRLMTPRISLTFRCARPVEAMEVPV